MRQPSGAILWGLLCAPVLSGPVPASEALRVTAETRADAQTLEALERPGEVFFSEDFESAEALDRFFEVNGRSEGHARWLRDPARAHSGSGAVQFTAPARAGKESGSGASAWFGPTGYDRVYFRRYIRFAADYDQGSLHHVGGGLTGVAGTDRWRGMGTAGLLPRGDDYFKSRFEPWRDWGRYEAPGYLFLYTYWMEMERDKDGHYWGNMLGPDAAERMVPKRDRWICLEHMIQTNDPGEANGALAAWVDGRLYLHFKGLRWRSTPEVRIKRCDIGIYVHQATRDNTVWYDDMVLSTGYIGPREAADGGVPGSTGPAVYPTPGP